MAGVLRQFVAVDIGGTKVAAGIVNERGTITHEVRVPIVVDKDAATAFSAVEQAITAVTARFAKDQITALGISAPGPLDANSGVILNPPNLPCWRNYPLLSEVRKLVPYPILLENDANAAALAEAIWGAGAGSNIVFYATLGTGIGSGLVLDGKLYHGRTGAAPEAGHITLDYNGPLCGCGKRGCIEALASGPAIAVRARTAMEKFPDSRLWELADGHPSRVTAEMVAEAWRAGDECATVVLRKTSILWAIWLGCVIDLLEPDVIVIGGGLGPLASQWFDAITEVLPQWCLNQRCREIPIRLANYAENAGIAGAAALCVRPAK